LRLRFRQKLRTKQRIVLKINLLFPFGFGVHVFISKNAVLYSERTYYKQIFDKNFFIVFLATSTFGSGKVGKKNGAFMA